MADRCTQIMFRKTYFVLLIFCFNCQLIFGKQSEEKSSLIFVIDDTHSMSDDIHQVRSAAKLILDTVLESKASRIGNFVLVRFNDPDIKPAFITTNKEDYIRALDDIVLRGNFDCPEMAMKGIEEALIKGLSRSYVFVFTDASAKDYKDFERIKRIAQDKSSQIIFVLTGLCSTEDDPAYVVYHELAKATSGQVFHLKKNEINKILQYVIEIVKAPRTVLAEKEFGSGYGNKLFYTVDGKIEDVIVAISGKRPNVEVRDPFGGNAKHKIILETANILVIMIINTVQGTHTVIVGSLSKTKVIITGATTFDFTYGFSPLKPTSIKDTATVPTAGQLSYLAIEVDNPDNDVELNEVNLLDTNNNVLQVLSLNKIDDDFYITNPIVLPDTMFKILVKGFIKGTKIAVERISPTPIEPEKPAFILPKLKEIATKLEIKRYDSIHISCIVTQGWPQPRMRWYFKPQEALDFIQISEISETMHIPSADVDRSGIYRCEAYNAHGSAVIDVIVVILSAPVIKDDVNIISTQSGKIIDIHCAVTGFPTPIISWKFNEGSVGTTHVIFGKTNTLRIKASLKNAGIYTCEAANVLGVAKRTIQVIVYESPKIRMPTETTIQKLVGCSLTLTCEATGFPVPSIQWTYYNNDTIDRILSNIDNSGNLHIPELKIAENGYYVCIAENSHGSAKINYTVKVLSPPSIIKSPHVNVEAFIGDPGLELLCRATGNPKPTIAWTKDGVYIPTGNNCYSDTKYAIKNDGTLMIGNIDHFSNGIYTCVATNTIGIDIDTFNVIVSGSSRPDKLDKIINIEVGVSTTINCHIPHGPTDVVTWHKGSSIIATGQLILNNPQLSDKGIFTCKVNAAISASISIQVGFKPKFVQDENKYVGFFLDQQASLPCVARGEPLPKVSWSHNGRSLEVEAMLYTFKMSEAAAGDYICTVSNVFGTITRNFYVEILF